MFLRENRLSVSPAFTSTYTNTQLSCDALFENFSNAALDSHSIAAMSVGSLAYQSSHLALNSLFRNFPLTWMSRALTPLLALGTEVTAFQSVHRLLANSSTNPSESFWGKAWMTSFVHFACLKSLGHLYHGNNIVTLHALQASAVVVGQQLTGGLGWTLNPQGNFADQFLQAEAENIQMNVGNAFARTITGQRLQCLEFQLRSSSGLLAENNGKRSESTVPVFSIVDWEDGAPFPPPRPRIDLNELYLKPLSMITWSSLPEGRIERLLADYLRMDVEGRRAFHYGMARSVITENARRNILSFLRGLDYHQSLLALENVTREAFATAPTPDTVSRWRKFMLLYPSLGDEGARIVARAYGEALERLATSNEHHYSNETELVQELYVQILEGNSQGREFLIPALRAFANRKSNQALFASTRLGLVIEDSGWTQDAALLSDFFGHVAVHSDIFEERQHHETYRETAERLFGKLASEEQNVVLDHLCSLLDEPQSHKLQILAFIEKNLIPFARADVRARFFERVESMLDHPDAVRVKFALRYINEQMMSFYNREKRTQVFGQLVHRLADADRGVVDLTIDIFRNHFGRLGDDADPVLERAIRRINNSNHGFYGEDYIAYMSGLWPSPLRERFVDGVWPTLRRRLLR